MVLWKNSVGENRVDRSRVTVLDRRRRVEQRLEVSGWKMKRWRIGRRTELARWNIELDEIRETVRGLVVQWSKGKKNNSVLNAGFYRKPL